MYISESTSRDYEIWENYISYILIKEQERKSILRDKFLSFFFFFWK